MCDKGKVLLIATIFTSCVGFKFDILDFILFKSFYYYAHMFIVKKKYFFIINNINDIQIDKIKKYHKFTIIYRSLE